ncbi:MULTISPECIES: hypothetical protein [unclassified Mesorhizobium]|uniref:hypothetical protein n=1 Tax=unclassified Mesorhizobium TaxID=325217 RepID=UPI0015E4115A|nr:MULTISPECIES: hypothetical protein [unclassified Mesorhizobium]
MIDDDASLRTRLSGNIDEVERLTTKITSVDVDETILPVSERIRSLAESKVRYVSAGLDLPNRRMELQIFDNTVASCLAALGRSSEPNPAALLLPAATVGVVRNMIEQRSGIATGVRGARDEAAAALDARQTARARVGEERAVPGPARARLGSALSKARGSGHLREIKTAHDAEDAGGIRWEAALARLHPWSGDARALARMSVPSASQLGQWKKRITELGKSRAVLSERLAEHQDTQDVLTARLDTLRASENITDDEAAATIRRARDEAWARYRDDLTGETADDFAIVLARDDSVGAFRLVNARELAEIRTTVRSLAETVAAIARMDGQLAQLDLDGEAVLAEIREAGRELMADCLESLPERLIDLIEERASARTDALARSEARRLHGRPTKNTKHAWSWSARWKASA